MATSDQNLLRAYVQQRDEDAFRTLTQRYLGLIFHVAYRQTNNRTLSQDISQSVLLALSKKAPLLLKKSQDLAPWLHRTTLYESTKAMRSEQSQQRRKEGLAQKIETESPSQPSAWKEALPHLDEALNKLPESDRRVLILHFFEEKTFPKVAQALGKTPAAAQKQSRRALEKLAQILKRKGVVISSLALGSCLSSELAKAAPPSVLKALSTITLTCSPPLLGIGAILSTKGPQVLAIAASASLVTFLGARQIEITQKKNHNKELQTQLAQAPLKSNRPLRKANPSATGHYQPDAKLLAEAYYNAEKSKMGSVKTALRDYLSTLDEDVLAHLLSQSMSALLPRKHQGSFLTVLIDSLSQKNPERAVRTVFESYERDRSQDFRKAVGGHFSRSPFTAWYESFETSSTARLWLENQEELIAERKTDGAILNPFRMTVLTNLLEQNDPDAANYLHSFSEENQSLILANACGRYFQNYQKEEAEVIMQLCQHLNEKNRRRVLRKLTSKMGEDPPLQWVKDLQDCSHLLEADQGYLMVESGKEYLLDHYTDVEGIANFHQWLQEKELARSDERFAEALIKSSQRGLRAASAYSHKYSPDGWLTSYLGQEEIPSFFREPEYQQPLRSLVAKVSNPTERQRLLKHLSLEN